MFIYLWYETIHVWWFLALSCHSICPSELHCLLWNYDCRLPSRCNKDSPGVMVGSNQSHCFELRSCLSSLQFWLSQKEGVIDDNHEDSRCPHLAGHHHSCPACSQGESHLVHSLRTQACWPRWPELLHRRAWAEHWAVSDQDIRDHPAWGAGACCVHHFPFCP